VVGIYSERFAPLDSRAGQVSRYCESESEEIKGVRILPRGVLEIRIARPAHNLEKGVWLLPDEEEIAAGRIGDILRKVVSF
jgi:preprotein translocase subunit Sec61beta